MTPSPRRQQNRPPTIIDVAAVAGVSKSTVSNILQGKIPVQDQTRRRVLDAIAQLGYQPNAGARYMRQRSRILGVVVGDLRNPFYAEAAAHIEEYAALRDHTILLATTADVPEREVDRVQTLLEHRVAAMIFMCVPGRAALTTVSDDVTRVFSTVSMPGAMSIAVDNRIGAELAVRHLAVLGHTAIGYVGVTLHEPPTETVRYDGFRKAMEKAGLAVRSSLVLRPTVHHDGSPRADQDALRTFLSRTNRPTAIVAATDFDALELISAADTLGITVPDDLSLVGFDNISLAGHSRIALTTVAQPMGEIARLTIDVAIDGRLVVDGRRRSSVKLAPELVVRRSTGPASPEAARRT
jgi:LacI family transcriptional regulator